MNIPEIQKNNPYYFFYFWITLIFGVYFYELIGWKPLDELMEAALLLLFGLSVTFGRVLKFSLDIKIFLSALLFYTIYSFIIGSNKPIAILIDIILQIKPFAAFFCFYYAGIRFNDDQKRIIRQIAFVLFIYTILVGIHAIIDGRIDDILSIYFGHESRFSTGLVILGLIYLYCSPFKREDIWVFLIMMTIGLLSAKGKFFGFYAASIFVLLFMKGITAIKLNLKNVIIAAAMICLVTLAAKEKVMYYFVDFNLIDEVSMARPLLYYNSLLIICDYFPFGSGFASFATHASGAYYSKIYEQYHLDGIWGLTADDPMFVTDTHYPSLAQFGIVGVILFVLFWVRIIREANKLNKIRKNPKLYLIIVLATLFLFIEMVADATFTYNRGFITMIMIALALNEMKDTESDANMKPVENDEQ